MTPSCFKILRITMVLLVFCFICLGQVFAEEDRVVGQPYKKTETTIVNVAIWMSDIDSVDSAAQSFVASVFLRLRWSDPQLAHKELSDKIFAVNKVWTPGIQIVNEIGRVRRTMPETVTVENDGTVIYRQRYVGPFSQPLNLRDFPFDEQLFRLHLVPTASERKVEFVADNEWIELGFEQASGISEGISLPDWEILRYAAGPQPYKLIHNIETVGYAFDFVAKRDSKYYIYKVIMPLLLIVFMSWSVFWINPNEAGIQISVSTVSMLTLIAYRFMVDSLVPKVSYLTQLDEFILGSTILVFFCLLQVILTSSLMRQGKESLSLKVDYSCRFLFPVLFIGVLLYSFGI